MSANEIWASAEIRNNEFTRASFQAIAGAVSLAGEKGLSPVAVLCGGEPAHAEKLARFCPTVVRLESAGLSGYEATVQVDAISQLMEKRGSPSVILAPASASGLEWMPALAARAKAGYAGYCIKIEWEGDKLTVRRPIYGGRVYEDVSFTSAPALATVRPGAFPMAEELGSAGSVETVSVTLSDRPRPSVTDRQVTAAGGQDLAESARVVAGGRGMGGAENFKLLEELANVLGGAVAASRAVVDAGWRPHDEQVGKSGRTIAPELYIACGISGAIHHVLGMNTAKFVAAVNTDPEAPIFQNADYGLVGDAVQVVPALTEALKKALNK